MNNIRSERDKMIKVSEQARVQMQEKREEYIKEWEIKKKKGTSMGSRVSKS